MIEILCSLFGLSLGLNITLAWCYWDIRRTRP